MYLYTQLVKILCFESLLLTKAAFIWSKIH